MYKNIFITGAATLTFALCAPCTAQAEEVTSDEAIARIVAQWNSTTGSRRAPVNVQMFSLAKVGTVPQHEGPAYYVFNRMNGGFVVAPADDEQPAILALIDEGDYDETCLPDGFKAWLREVTAFPPSLTIRENIPAGKSVDPLLAADQIAWNQNAPYNTDCPKFYYQGWNYDTLAGCAAIAAGQIMRYYKYPAKGSGSVSYESYIGVQGQEIVTAVDRDFSHHTYDWSKIRGNYVFTGNGTAAERAEVAKFVADVACASYMNFDPTASATTDLRVAQALKQHFGYDRSLQLVDHSFYSTEEWADLLRAELDAHRPVYLSGANVTNTANGDMLSGHAFVVDGYNADGLFHINWGWGGTSDGLYALTSLTPRNQGAGGSTGGYSFMSNAIIGIQPDQGGEEAKALLSLSGEYWETSYDAENDGYVVRVNIANVSASDFEGFVALRLMEGDTQLLAPKQLAWKLGCKAGAAGVLGKGINKDFFLLHPNARIELMYAHCPGVNTATAAQQTEMLESIADNEWIPIAVREGAPRSLQSFTDAGERKVAFGNVADEVYQLRLAGLTSDVTPKAGVTVKFTATVTNLSRYEYFAPLYLFVYDRNGNFIDYSSYELHQLAPYATEAFEFEMTLPAGFSKFAIAYEDKGYDWSYVPMPLYTDDGSFATTLFDPVLQPAPEGFVFGDVDQSGRTELADVKALERVVLMQQPATVTSDIDNSRTTTIGDVTALIKHLLKQR